MDCVPPAILDALVRGQTVLTAGQRAERTLRQAFDRGRPAEGRILWTPPSIYALETWLETLWRQLVLEGAETRLLLNPVQEHTVWRGIVAADREVSGLRSIDGLADTAAAAFRLLHLHLGRGRLREFAASTESRAFERWTAQFDRACARNQWLSRAQLPAALGTTVVQGRLPLPDAGLLLVDFDAHPPGHEALLESIRRAGYPVEALETGPPTASTRLLGATDAAAEIRAAAQWASTQLAYNAERTVAIVVPNLADRRPVLERTFSEFLPAMPAPFEFSVGGPLAETAPVAAALDLLRWTSEALPLGAISALLLAPSFIPPEELSVAAEFDAFELRHADLLRPELSLDTLLDLLLASRHRASQLAGLIARLRSLRRAGRNEHSASDTRGHAAWADSFRALLAAAGWTTHTSLDFQIRRRWDSALDALATLDFDGTRASFAEALRSLTRIAGEAVFAPESRRAPIQIMGPLEAGGVPFDALWFLSADDQTWPSPRSTNPLLPWNLQRELGIAAASPAVADAHGRALTRRLAHSAAEAVFSFSHRSEDGERRPSPLLRGLDLQPLPISAEPHPDPSPTEVFTDTESLPLLPDQVTPGGARILELQAACAFRAFAEIRLRSTAPDSRQPGLDARERGIHVHTILQVFWASVRDQETLRALARPDREALLDECIERAIARAAASAHTPWDHAYLDVQRRRLRTLLHPWLDLELTRPPFRVLAQEQTLDDARLGPLRLKLRADRIDQTGGGLLVLDYKTGAANPTQWLTDRPDAPQLPLYAVLASHDEALGGVAFALLRAGEDLKLTGFTQNRDTLDKSSSAMTLPLEEHLAEWRQVLTALAEAFAHADPIADPKSYPGTCHRCGQRILCRLDPAALYDEEPDESQFNAESP